MFGNLFERMMENLKKVFLIMLYLNFRTISQDEFEKK